MWRCLGLLICSVLGAASPAAGTIMGYSPLKIDFKKPKEASGQFTWSDPQHLGMTAEGFGWQDEKNASRDGWIETQPFGIGTSWRPTRQANIRIKLETDYPAIVKTGESSKAFYVPSIYVRHSPDRQHWSDWQPLDISEDPRNAGKVLFTGSVGVARRSSQDYDDRLQAWSKRDDVAWSSDEDEFCTWLLTQDPKYFDHHRPFVGYVQFLVEGSFRGSQRLQSLDAEISWAVGGVHSICKDPASEKKHEGNGSWRFPSK